MITERLKKKAPLTHKELDDNFKYGYRWKSNVEYESDMIVVYDDSFWRCLGTHTSGSVFDKSKWKQFSTKTEFEGDMNGYLVFEDLGIIEPQEEKQVKELVAEKLNSSIPPLEIRESTIAVLYASINDTIHSYFLGGYDIGQGFYGKGRKQISPSNLITNYIESKFEGSILSEDIVSDIEENTYVGKYKSGDVVSKDTDISTIFKNILFSTKPIYWKLPYFENVIKSETNKDDDYYVNYNDSFSVASRITITNGDPKNGLGAIVTKFGLYYNDSKVIELPVGSNSTTHDLSDDTKINKVDSDGEVVYKMQYDPINSVERKGLIYHRPFGDVAPKEVQYKMWKLWVQYPVYYYHFDQLPTQGITEKVITNWKKKSAFVDIKKYQYNNQLSFNIENVFDYNVNTPTYFALLVPKYVKGKERVLKAYEIGYGSNSGDLNEGLFTKKEQVSRNNIQYDVFVTNYKTLLYDEEIKFSYK